MVWFFVWVQKFFIVVSLVGVLCGLVPPDGDTFSGSKDSLNMKQFCAVSCYSVL